jgi:hypothetical protein
MALSDIAAGVEVTTSQRDRGVAAVDETDASLSERWAPVTNRNGSGGRRRLLSVRNRCRQPPFVSGL